MNRDRTEDSRPPVNTTSATQFDQNAINSTMSNLGLVFLQHGGLHYEYFSPIIIIQMYDTNLITLLLMAPSLDDGDVNDSYIKACLPSSLVLETIIPVGNSRFGPTTAITVSSLVTTIVVVGFPSVIVSITAFMSSILFPMIASKIWLIYDCLRYLLYAAEYFPGLLNFWQNLKLPDNLELRAQDKRSGRAI
uniref:Uncharacterized protein n=1 Tax=Glossina pallidipes TaxID=7398 RepID=A0A1B0A3T1_GLOPL